MNSSGNEYVVMAILLGLVAVVLAFFVSGEAASPFFLGAAFMLQARALKL